MILILILTSIGMWLCHFLLIHSTGSVNSTNEQLFFDASFQNTLPRWLIQLLLFCVIAIGAFFVNYLTISQEITSKTNYLPAFLYIIFAFVSNTSSTIEPILISNLFVLLGLYFLISSYKQENVISAFFNAGLFLCLATFFYKPYIIIIPSAFIALFILRPFNWRERLLLLLGLLVPLYLYACIAYLTNHKAFEIVTYYTTNLSHFQKPIVSEYYFLFLIVVIFILCLTIFFYATKGLGNKIKTTKTKFIILWFLCLSLLLVFQVQTTDMILLPCIIPLSILLGDYLAEIKQLKIANTLLFLFLSGVVVIYLHVFGVF